MSQANIPNVPLYLNGEKVQSTAKEWRDVLNPATQEVVARVPFATKEEVDRAVANAKDTSRPGAIPRWPSGCASCSSSSNCCARISPRWPN